MKTNINENVLKRIILFFLIMISFEMFAQGEIIKGKITSKDGVGIPGVFVSQKSSKNGTISDIEGNYSIKLVAGTKSLLFSFIGYEKKEIPVGEKLIINVVLAENQQQLDEVVIVGYGTTKRRDLTGSVSTVKRKDIEDQVFKSIGETLQGQASGVFVNSDSGEPGGGISINIRGINSISGSTQPLYILDGIPLSLDTQAQGGSNQVATNPLASLNPNDIESIEILKDASATAIYGARASNGVVLIQTKSAKSGKTVITTDFRTSISSVGDPINLMSASHFNKSRNDFAVILRPDLTYEQLIAQSILPFRGQSAQTQLPENAGQGTDFLGAVLREGINKFGSVSISGGTNALTQLLSVTFEEDEGNIVNTRLNRFNLRYNSTMKRGDNFTLTTNLQLNNLKNIRVQTSARTGLTGVTFNAIRMNPNIPLFALGTDELNIVDENDVNVTNPVIEAFETDNEIRDKSIVFGTAGVLKLSKNLVWTNRIGFNGNVTDNLVFNNKKTFQGRLTNGNLFLSGAQTYRTTIESFLNYKKDFKNHKLDATFGVSYEDENALRRSEVYTNFTFDDLGIDNLALAKNSDNQSTLRTNQTLQASFYRFNYIYKGKFFFTTTGRVDGSSRFSQGQPWGFFPSAAVSWDIQKEKLIKNNFKAISQFKMRLSYGETGSINGVQPYSTLDTYSIGITPLQDNISYNTTFPTRIANRNLQWETSTTLNLGIDLNFFKNRLRTSVDVYERTTNNLLNNLPIPVQTGFLNVPVNDGKLENKGIEIDVAYDIFNNKKFFGWTTKMNLTKNRSKILEYGVNEFIEGPNIGANFFSSPASRTFIGQELGLFYGYNVVGLIQIADLVSYAPPFNIRTEPKTDANGVVTQVPIYATTGRDSANNAPGLFRFEDVNGDGIINILDRKTIGNPNPDFFFGWNNQFKIGKFNISLFIQGSVGNDILNLTRGFTGTGVVGSNSTEDWYERRWTLDNQHNDGRYPSSGGPRAIETPNSSYVEDGSYVRVKNLSVRYNVRDVKPFSNLALVLTGTNLLTFTKYSGADPEVSTNGNGALDRGVDYTAYPRPKVYSLGINLSL